MKNKIFITGGHFTPAQAVIEKLTGWEIFYIGRKYAMEGDKAEALEYKEIKNVHYLVITTGRLQRKFFVNIKQSIFALLKTPIGFMQTFWWLIRYQPKIILSFGGYVAIPVVINAWLLDIPIITHEQTQTVGLANKIISLLANKVLKGSILRKEIIETKITQTNTIFITGGSQGSHVINVAVEEIIEKLTPKYQVIHQIGDSAFGDFERSKKIKNYLPTKFLTGEQQAKAMASARIIISRAGANTLAEIAYFGKPAILIPIPWASAAEQEKNAQVLADLGMAEVISQNDLSGKTLLSAIKKIDDNYELYLENAKKGKTVVNPDAAKEIVEEISNLIDN